MRGPALRYAPGVQSCYVELPHGMRIAFDAYGRSESGAGAAAPLVLLLHGGGQTRHAWGGTAEALAAAGCEAWSLDLRGHGDSGWDPEGAYAYTDFAKDVAALIAAQDRRPILVGASLGGLVSLAQEARHPGSTAALVIVDITPRMRRDGVDRILRFMGAAPQGFASLEEAAEAIARYLPHRKRPPSLDGLRKNLRLGEDGRYRWHWDPRLLAAWDHERREGEDIELEVSHRLEALRAIEVPTLLVRGRMSDIITEEHAKELLEAIPHARYVDLAGATHMVAGDKNDAFTASVLDFLTSIEALPRSGPAA